MEAQKGRPLPPGGEQPGEGLSKRLSWNTDFSFSSRAAESRWEESIPATETHTKEEGGERSCPAHSAAELVAWGAAGAELRDCKRRPRWRQAQGETAEGLTCHGKEFGREVQE